MNHNKVYSFMNEKGDLVNYTVKEYLSLNNTDYVLMSPENNASLIEVYKFTFENGNEALDLVNNEKELTAVKSASKVI